MAKRKEANKQNSQWSTHTDGQEKGGKQRKQSMVHTTLHSKDWAPLKTRGGLSCYVMEVVFTPILTNNAVIKIC